MLPKPPPPLDSLLLGETENLEFLSKIRSCNSAFQMTSMGCDKILFLRHCNSCYKIQGQIYHRFGHLCQENNEKLNSHKYILWEMKKKKSHCVNLLLPGLTPGTVAYLQQMLHSHNSYVESLKMAHEISLTKQPSKLHRTPTTGRQTTTVSLPINHTYCTTRPPYATSIAHNPKQTRDTPLPVRSTGCLASSV